jgi:uncharacterized protein
MKTLCIMVKEPAMGRVKTRLAREIGNGAAVAAYRMMLDAVVRRLRGGREWRLVLAVAPDAAILSRALPNGVARQRQGRGDLGQRMQRVFDHNKDAGPVVIIGSDIPTISRAAIRDAFKALQGHDAVIGPADDGGYWLIGTGRRRRVAPFAGVAWSTDQALAGTLKNLAGLRIAILQSLRDVDTAKDWRDWTRQPAAARLNGL